MLLLLSQLLTHTGEGNEHLELLTKEYLKNAADKCNELFNEGESEILESANATMLKEKKHTGGVKEETLKGEDEWSLLHYSITFL